VKTWKILLVVVVLMVAVPVMADLTGNDIVLTAASSDASLTTGLGNPLGASFVDFATDGTAWAKLIWFRDGCTDRADSTQIARKLVVQLRDYTPPRSLYFPSGPDSVKSGLITATEVILSR
jgi:hypothetical protein